ncbi:maleylacetoacetate isomerase [Lichenibacterium ramalinae]|uniref:Maleylacetoacetate isomerase n=1 Tax=Lichenibacterium ramalinae TaxID=2316527 RepID=A0A4Q2RBP4_9HYPH|nr:maleylacetoacetate isomerase [Lichenibacterium ramalinae]RYB04760.1 maleylacetoacetate isomerase [Lichenibacterium ramalinae]
MTDASQPLEFYGYWRSNAMYRLRVALNLKGVPYREIPVDLDAGEQHAPDFVARNPMAAVPALIDGDLPPLTQSLALLEYLEERYPEPPILPADARGRARVRALAATVAADTHPLLVPRVRHYLTERGGFDADAFRAWVTHWVGQGLVGLEANLAHSPETGRFCHGDRITMADICVSGLALIGRVFKLDLPETPVLSGIVQRCLAEEAFARAEPSRQPDAPKG